MLTPGLRSVPEFCVLVSSINLNIKMTNDTWHLQLNRQTVIEIRKDASCINFRKIFRFFSVLLKNLNNPKQSEGRWGVIFFFLRCVIFCKYRQEAARMWRHWNLMHATASGNVRWGRCWGKSGGPSKPKLQGALGPRAPAITLCFQRAENTFTWCSQRTVLIAQSGDNPCPWTDERIYKMWRVHHRIFGKKKDWLVLENGWVSKTLR